MSPLDALRWWISTASVLAPFTRPAAVIENACSVSSPELLMSADASVVCEIAPAGRFERATSTPFR